MRSDGFHLSQPRLPHQFTGSITLERDLFRVWHLGLPEVDPALRSITIGGFVERPTAFTLEELRQRPQTTVTAFHECAGNPLHPLVPQRRIGNVEGGGVPLADILREADLKPGAAFVLSRGADHDSFPRNVS